MYPRNATIYIPALALLLASSSITCATESLIACGNGVCPSGYTCQSSPDGPRCITFTGCGNLVTEDGEACDDGNVEAGDGCSPSCQIEICGNGVIDPGEQCDCGDDPSAGVSGCGALTNSDDSGICRLDCMFHCGDGEIRGDELCDSDLLELSCIDINFDRGLVSCSDACSPIFEGCGRIGWQAEGIGGESVFDIWGNGPDDVYAARRIFLPGDSQLLHYDGSQWSPIDLPPRSTFLSSVWSSGPRDVFAVGLRGDILRYDGSEWTWSTTSGPDLNKVWGSGPDDPVWAVDADGAIWRYDRAADDWQEEPVVATVLSGLGGSGPNSIFALGGEDIFHYDGASWDSNPTRELPPGYPTLELMAVWSTGPTHAFAVGGDGVILEWDGAAWSAMNLCGEPGLQVPCAGSRLRAVWGARRDNAFAAGENGEILHYDGNSAGIWTLVESDIDVQLEGIWGSGSGDVVAVGLNGAILRYQTQAWASHQLVEGSLVDRLWGSSSTDVYGILLDMMRPGELVHFDGVGPTLVDTGIRQRLRGLFGLSADEIYVVGNQTADAISFSRYTSATGWLPMSIAGDVPILGLRDVWAANDGTVFAVGEAEVHPELGQLTFLLHCDNAGSPCQRQELITDVEHYDLDAVWGCSASDVVAVGLNGRIARYDGERWAHEVYPDEASLQNTHLRDVWSSSCDDFVAVGDQGLILHYNKDSGSWERKPSGTDQVLRGVWGTGPNDIYAVGNGGVVLFYNGERWSPVRSNTQENLQGLWGEANSSGSSSAFFFAGAGGTLLNLVR